MWTFILWISAAVYQAEGKAGNVPFSPFFSVTLVWIITREGGGGYSHTYHIQVCATQRGCDFEAHDSEGGIHFRGVF